MSESAIPTEPIGSIPRTEELVRADKEFREGRIGLEALNDVADRATSETIREFEKTGSPVISDGEQRKYGSFAFYCLHGAENLAPDGVEVGFSDGHSRQLPRLTGGPFRYTESADGYLESALKQTRTPVKQAVISPSLLSLIYPGDGIVDYPRERFMADLVREHVGEVRRCLDAGAHAVQIDFTEGRLAVKLDPSGELLRSFVALLNTGLESFTDEERTRLGVHTCPGGDWDATHSADVDYLDLLPALFEIDVGNFYVAMASEKDPGSALQRIGTLIRPGHRVFIGVIDAIDPRVESPGEVRDRVVAAAEFIPPAQLGTTDDCGFSPFADDQSTSRELAFAKIRARVEGTRLAEDALGSA